MWHGGCVNTCHTCPVTSGGFSVNPQAGVALSFLSVPSALCPYFWAHVPLLLGWFLLFPFSSLSSFHALFFFCSFPVASSPFLGLWIKRHWKPVNVFLSFFFFLTTDWTFIRVTGISPRVWECPCAWPRWAGKGTWWRNSGHVLLDLWLSVVMFTCGWVVRGYVFTSKEAVEYVFLSSFWTWVSPRILKVKRARFRISKIEV